MNVIITGNSGFVGTNLSNHLINHNINVSAISMRDASWKEQIEKSSEAIIHLAGKAHDTLKVSDPDEYYKINRDLTIELFDEFLNSEIKKYFYFSSVKAVADTLNDILKEDKTPNPQTHYGKSKIEAEKYILSKKIPQGKEVYIIRPCMIHGPGNKGNLNLLYKIVEKGLPWPLAAFHNQRSFLSIDNLSFLIFKMLTEKNLPSGIYNFADDTAISTNELITIVNKALEKKAKLWNISKTLIEKVAFFGDKLHLPLNSERLKKLTESYIVSNQKIKSALKLEKLPMSAEEGLTKTIVSFKNK